MSTITTRAGKGSPLTNNEVDANFTNLNTDKAELSGATFTGDVASTGFSGDITGAVLFQAKAGEALTKGDPVYISGISGNQTVVSKADANDANKMPCFGIVDATVSINANCSVVTFGTLSSLDTSAFGEGDELYISDTGTLSTTAPTGEASQLQKIAKVTRSHASSGSIKVMGAGRTNATPNLDDGKFFLGNSSNQSASATFSTSVTGIALPLSGGAMTGAITTNSTFDGRDVATDGSKLDGIESGATADQTAAEIKTAYESNADTNAFTDAAESKLSGIEASADVTDTTNVTAAGALMDSELTSIASVKALNQGVATTDSPTFAGLTVDTNTLYVDSTNNRVGIGTSSPAYQLDTGTLGHNSTGELLLTGGNSASNDYTQTTLLRLRATSINPNSTNHNSVNAAVAEIRLNHQDLAGNASSGNLTFYTNSGNNIAGALTERMRIDSSGNLTTRQSTGNNFRVIRNGDNSIEVGNYNATDGYQNTSYVSSTHSFYAGTAGAGSAPRAVDIDSSGRLLVGQTYNYPATGGGTTKGVFAAHADSRTDLIVSNQTNGSNAGAALVLGAHGHDHIIESQSVLQGSALTFTKSTVEHMRIDSSGNVGIGNDSPSSFNYLSTSPHLVVGGGSSDAGVTYYSSTNGYGRLAFADGTNTTEQYRGLIQFYHGDNSMQFYTGSDERMRISSAGNVGIGRTDPQAKLHLQDTGDVHIQFTDEGNIAARVGANGNAMVFGVDGANGTTERMRIDSSGNLLVGTTATDTAAVGFRYRSSLDAISSVADGGISAYFGRRTSDGDIVAFRKNDAIVGSIGASSGYTKITSGDGTNGSGLQFGDSKIYPVEANSVVTDNAVDFGDSNYRFKDLYLSGGVYLGGTGAANKLDDYEEGTFTPFLDASSTDPSLSYSTQVGAYEKIGALVHASFFINVSAVNSQGSGTLRIAGLPFNASSNVNASEVPAVLLQTEPFNAGDGAGYQQYARTNSNSNVLFMGYKTGTGSASIPAGASHVGTGYLIGHIVYRTLS
jgi:hypothetical protein